MRTLLLLISTVLFTNMYTQDFAQKIVGNWEVKQTDNKIFTTGVITYFEFTENNEIFSKSINGENHGVIPKEQFIGNFTIQGNKAEYKTNESSFEITLKEDDQLIIKELKIKNNKITLYRTSFLSRKN